MLSVAEAILKNARSKEVDSAMMPIKNVITMIDEDPARRAMLSVKRGKEEKKEDKPEAKKPRTGDAPAEAKVTPKAAPAPKAAATSLAKTKVEPKAFLAYMRSLGVNFFAGVPDSCIATFCAELDSPSAGMRHVITANEGASVGMALGHHMATGEVPLVYMQNSGLGNAVNPLLSAAHPEVYACPMVLLVGWRGAPDASDEPQHQVQGEPEP